MRILWIEDNPNLSKDECFGGFASNTVHIHKFEEAYEAVANQLEAFDYVVLDIDLSESEIGDHAIRLMKRLELRKSEFLKKSGFDLFVQLMEQGFPKERIIFFTANTSGENKLKTAIQNLRQADEQENEEIFPQALDSLRDELSTNEQKYALDKAVDVMQLPKYLSELEAELRQSGIPQTYEVLQEQFRTARIEIPNAESKSNPEGFSQWLQQNCQRTEANKATYDYLTLRRGILNALGELTGNGLEFTDDFSEDLDKAAFLEGLRWLLQAHELRPERAGQFYLTLCDYLTKPFERFNLWGLIPCPVPRPSQEELRDWTVKRSSRIPAYFLRNWIAHGLIAGSKTPDLEAQDAGFTFLIVMQSLFGQEMYGHGNELRQLFEGVSTDQKTIRDQIVKLQKQTYKNPHKMEKLEEIQGKGQKDKNPKMDKKQKWKDEDFLLHFYASYLLASTKLVRGGKKDKLRSVEINERRKNKYTVYLNYELQQTPFLETASSQLKPHLRSWGP